LRSSAFFLFLTYYMQQVKGYSPLTTGLLFLPLVAGILVASTLYSALPQVGPRLLITLGMLLGAGGAAYLAQLTVTSSYPGGVLPALLVMGLGFGMIFAPAVNTATAGVPREDSGVASALVNTMQQVGGSIGISILSTIAASATTSYLIAHHTGPQAPAIAATHGYTLAFTISAALLGLGAILAIIMLPSRNRLEQLTSEAPALISEPETEPEPESASPGIEPQHQPGPELQPAERVMPVGLLCCSPVIDPGLPPAARPFLRQRSPPLPFGSFMERQPERGRGSPPTALMQHHSLESGECCSP
jgi:MFS family permease